MLLQPLPKRKRGVQLLAVTDHDQVQAGNDEKELMARRLFDVFEPIQRHVFTHPGSEPIVMITELSPLQRKLLRILGLPEGIYQ
jgi:hypothetical protein